MYESLGGFKKNGTKATHTTLAAAQTTAANDNSPAAAAAAAAAVSYTHLTLPTKA